MKNILFTLLLLSGLLFVACSDDDDNENCQLSDYLGTWEGMENCESIGELPVTYTIIQGDNSDEIIISDGAIDIVAKVDGCSIKLQDEYDGEGALEGDRLSFNYDDGFLLTCSANLSK